MYVRILSFISIASICLCLDSFAAGSNDTITSYPTDFGSIVMGGAIVIPNSIKWDINKGVPTGVEALVSPAADLTNTEVGFGFTGEAYLPTSQPPSNKWVLKGRQDYEVFFSATSPESASLGIYFAPSKLGDTTVKTVYEARFTNSSQNPNKEVPIKGNATEDDRQNPLIKLDVTTSSNSATHNSTCLNSSSCEDWNVSSTGEIQFTITASTSDTKIQYALVKLIVDEIGTNNCELSKHSYQHSVLTQNNYGNQYFHDITVPFNKKQCYFIENYFLTKVNQPFSILARSNYKTGGGYAQYHFYINGHTNRSLSDPNIVNNADIVISTALQDWVASQKVFRLRTDSTIVSNQKPVAAFSLPTSVTLNQSITLDASASTDSDGSIVSYEWSSSSLASTKFTSAASKTTSVYFTQAGSYAITLKVTDDDGDTNTLTKTITVTDSSQPQQTTLTVTVNNSTGGTVTSTDNAVLNCASTCSATYTKNASVTLTPVATTGYKFDSWSSDCAKNGVASDGSITVTMDQTKTCTVTFVQKTTPIASNACFTMEYLDDRIDLTKDEIRKVKLDAACSGTYSQYKWRLYSDSISNSKIFTTQEPITNLHDQFTGKVLPDGNYIATLIVGEGESQDQISQSLTIPPVLAKFNISLDSRKIILDASPSSKSKDSGTISYQWWTEYLGKLAPNTPGITMNNNIPSYLTIDYSNIPAALDNYETITLAITDSKGRVSTISQKAKVNLPAQVRIDDLSFVGNPTTNADGSLTVTLTALATDPDGGIVTYKFMDSYCTPTLLENKQCQEPKITMVKDSENKEKYQAAFNYSNQSTIAEAYVLQVTDGETGTEQTTASQKLRRDIPRLTSSTVNNKGNFGNTNTIFHGGVSIDNGRTYQSTNSAKTTQPLAIRGYFEVDPADVGQQAAILVIAGIENQAPFDGGIDTSYISYGGNPPQVVDLYQSPDVWMAQLTNPFLKSVTLATDMPLAQNLNLQLFTGTPTSLGWSPGQMYFFLGYRLTNSVDGKIVYSSQPVTLKIEQ